MVAVSRYDFVSIITDEKTKKERYGLSPRINGIDLFDRSDTVITTQEGESLDYLAEKYFNNGRYWWVIAIMNNLSLPVGDFMKGGKKLVIPGNISKIINAYSIKRNEK